MEKVGNMFHVKSLLANYGRDKWFVMAITRDLFQKPIILINQI